MLNHSTALTSDLPVVAMFDENVVLSAKNATVLKHKSFTVVSTCCIINFATL